LAVALLAGAISGTAVALLNDSDSDSGAPSTAAPEATPPAITTGFAEDAVAAVAVRSLPSVVAIVNQFEFEGVPSTAGGAGVIIDDRGYILTNAHLVQIPGEIFVLMSNGEVRPGQVVSHDAPFTDVAVIQVQEGGLTPLQIGDSAQLVPGQTVVAIGSPDIDYYNSVTTGVVSGLGRRKQLTNVWFEDLIQTDAAINTGNSGGPLVTLDGRMVGMVSNVVRTVGGFENVHGISFAISTRSLAPIIDSILTTGSFPRPYFGIDQVDLDVPTAAELGVTVPRGALVQAVTPDSPAAQAGIAEGDVILAVGGTEITESFTFLNTLTLVAPDERVAVDLLRGEDVMQVSVQLVPR
jgi:2-alkenal reductase